MQAGQVLFASILAAVSFGALAQEIDRSETLRPRTWPGKSPRPPSRAAAPSSLPRRETSMPPVSSWPANESTRRP